MDAGQGPPQRSSLWIAILAVAVVAGSAVGVMIYQLTLTGTSPQQLAGFDISETRASPHPRSATATNVRPGKAIPGSSSLGMIQQEDALRVRPIGGKPLDKSQEAAKTFTEEVRGAEPKVRNMAIRYTSRYPVIAQYGRDWMSYPDLRKLNDDYMVDHDPIKFLRGLSKSKNFGKLVSKYAMDPAIRQFVQDSVKQAPGSLMTALSGTLKDDSIIKGLLSNTSSALGLPPALIGGMLGGGQVDERQVMGQIMQSNPEMQKAMQNPDLQNATKGKSGAFNR